MMPRIAKTGTTRGKGRKGWKAVLLDAIVLYARRAKHIRSKNFAKSIWQPCLEEGAALKICESDRDRGRERGRETCFRSKPAISTHAANLGGQRPHLQSPSLPSPAFTFLHAFWVRRLIFSTCSSSPIT